jgi:hypothetical protein
MPAKITETCHFAMGLAPVADAFATATVYSDIVSMKNYNRTVFLVVTGVGTTGVSKFTVEACSTNAAAATSAVPFTYRTYANTDVPGAVTEATASDGFSNTAGSNRIHVIEVEAEKLAASGYSYVRLKAAETTDAEVLGGILIMQCEPKATYYVGTTSLV